MHDLSNPPLTLLLNTSQGACWLFELATGHCQSNALWTQWQADAAPADLPAQWLASAHPDEQAQLGQQLQALLSGELPQLISEHRLQNGDGWRWVSAQLQTLRDAQGKPSWLAASFSDITQHKLLDPYSRLPNRVLFLDRLERSLARLRHVQGHTVAVLILRLRLANGSSEMLTSEQQTELASLLGERINQEIRPWDLVAQFGRLDFAVLLEMLNSTDDLPRIFSRLMETLRQPISVGEHLLRVHVAIGAADSSVISHNEEELLHAAEGAAALALEHGDNQYVRFDPATQDLLTRRLHLESDLIRALQEGAFEPHFQPILRLSDGSLAGFEALVRWPRPSGIVSPSEFIPILERHGLISQLTWIMLQKSLLQHETWVQAGLVGEDSRVSINFPPEQLHDAALPGVLFGLLANVGIPTQRLKVEITESSLVRDSGQVSDTLRQLFLHDIEVALDDFGTGYSSMSMLHRFELSTLKIDRSFVDGLEQHEQSRSIIRAIIGLGQAMALGTTAEGVETVAQLDYLRSFGVSYGQGYLFSRPLPAEQVPHWLQNELPLLQKLFSNEESGAGA